jgi:murein DD-endopeptidase MepM/ murein hydrolase activator NlpD
MPARTPPLFWIILAGLFTGVSLSMAVGLTVGPRTVEAAPVRVALSPAAEAPAIPPLTPTSSPLLPLPALYAEKELWGNQTELFERMLLLPIQGLTKTKLRDSFLEVRGEHGEKRHGAIDLGAPHGRPILAVEDGTIQRIKWHVRGGLTIYQYGPEGRYSYYYAHLKKVAQGLREGCHVQRGEVIGYVGSTGSAPASAPHLHFEARRLADRKAWWSGDAINPYPLFLAGEERVPLSFSSQMAD